MLADAVRAPEPEAVVNMSINALSIVATAVETVEVRVAGRYRPDVFRSVKPSFGVFVVSVEADGDHAPTVLGR